MAPATFFLKHERPSHILVEEKSGLTLGNTTISGLEGQERVLQVRLIPVGGSVVHKKRVQQGRSKKRS